MRGPLPSNRPTSLRSGASASVSSPCPRRERLRPRTSTWGRPFGRWRRSCRGCCRTWSRKTRACTPPTPSSSSWSSPERSCSSWTTARRRRLEPAARWCRTAPGTAGTTARASPPSLPSSWSAPAVAARREVPGYEATHRRSLEDPEEFWRQAASAIEWGTPPGPQILDDSNPPFYRWFPGARLNTCHNALDRHADGGRGRQPALVYDSPVTGSVRTYTYAELRDEVARFAGVLWGLGVTTGDRVVIYMPMVPQAVIAMLACARLGAVHSVVFGGFASHELAIRIDHARPKVIVSASCGIEVGRVVEYKPLLDRALDEAAHPPQGCVVLQRPQATAEMAAGRDLDWDEAMAGASPVPCVAVEATDPLYVLYTSGTTGMPKGVVRDNGGHAVALAWSMANIYGVHPGDTYWAASDVGWVVGHSYIVYAPLLIGATTVLYEGKPVGTPDPGAFWRVVSEHQVRVLFTAPTAFRAIKKEDPKGEHLGLYDLGCMRTPV